MNLLLAIEELRARLAPGDGESGNNENDKNSSSSHDTMGATIKVASQDPCSKPGTVLMRSVEYSQLAVVSVVLLLGALAVTVLQKNGLHQPAPTAQFHQPVAVYHQDYAMAEVLLPADNKLDKDERTPIRGVRATENALLQGSAYGTVPAEANFVVNKQKHKSAGGKHGPDLTRSIPRDVVADHGSERHLSTSPPSSVYGVPPGWAWFLGGANSADSAKVADAYKVYNDFDDSKLGASYTKAGESSELLKLVAYKWMSALPDDTNLADMTIPGTHNSGAVNGHWVTGLWRDYEVCQTWSINQQLLSGIRWFDIRLKRKGGIFVIFHNTGKFQTFGTVMKEFKAWMVDNPTETIFMTVRNERQDLADGVFYQEWKEYMYTYSGGYSTLFHQNLGSGIPTLGQLRGKILLLRQNAKDFPKSTFGLSVGAISVLFDQREEAPSILTDKTNNVVSNFYEGLIRHSGGKVRKHGIYGSSLLWTPAEIAKAANSKFTELIGPGVFFRGLGVVNMDFPGEKLIYRLLKTNMRCLSSQPSCECPQFKGAESKSTRSRTISNKECKNWGNKMYNWPGGGLNKDENFCRNPDGSEHPWCYTNDAQTEREYCPVLPVCGQPKPNKEPLIACGHRSLRQSDYRGTKDTTASGRKCQRWDSQVPHTHTRTAANYPDADLKENYCRQPKGVHGSLEEAWCYTTDPDKRLESCGIPNCNEDSVVCGHASLFQSDYRGKKSTTASGRECQRWDSQSPHTHDRTAANYPDAGLENNYCRQPMGLHGSQKEAWCYTTDPNKRLESCGIPNCEEALFCGSKSLSQSDYRGTKTVSASGHECQRWDSQSPHSHTRTAANYPDAGLENNYCRAPLGTSGTSDAAWCYTMDPNERWEKCGIPSCEDHSPLRCGRMDMLQVDYRGTKATTKNGWTCQRWDTQNPNSHSRFKGALNHPDFSMENYCRNPDLSSGGAWCYTTDGNNRWDYCDVPNCV